MKLGRWRAAVLAGATAVVAAVLGLGGVATVVATAVPSSQVAITDIPEACSTTNGEYAQAPPTPLDCTGSGPAASIDAGPGAVVIDTIDTSSVPPLA